MEDLLLSGFHLGVEKLQSLLISVLFNLVIGISLGALHGNHRLVVDVRALREGHILLDIRLRVDRLVSQRQVFITESCLSLLLFDAVQIVGLTKCPVVYCKESCLVFRHLQHQVESLVLVVSHHGIGALEIRNFYEAEDIAR